MILRCLHMSDNGAGRRRQPPADGSRRALGALVVAGLLVVPLAAGVANLFAQEEEERTFPYDITHSVRDAPAPIAGAVFGTPTALHFG